MEKITAVIYFLAALIAIGTAILTTIDKLYKPTKGKNLLNKGWKPIIENLGFLFIFLGYMCFIFFNAEWGSTIAFGGLLLIILVFTLKEGTPTRREIGLIALFICFELLLMIQAALNKILELKIK